jgi:hypothetical protein
VPNLVQFVPRLRVHHLSQDLHETGYIASHFNCLEPLILGQLVMYHLGTLSHDNSKDLGLLLVAQIPFFEVIIVVGFPFNFEEFVFLPFLLLW